jgi:hypothetical protein
MKHVLIVSSCNRLMERETQRGIQDLIDLGAGHIDQTDTGDVSLARNLALSQALHLLQVSAYEVILMVDDDMGFSAEQALRLTNHVRETKVPASAAYVLKDGRLAASHLSGDRWLTGLGFLALHRTNLEALAAESAKFRPFKGAKGWAWELTKSCADMHDGDDLLWQPEDYRLTRRLGGVVLLPMAVDHIKKHPLRPDEKQLEAFIATERGKHSD